MASKYMMLYHTTLRNVGLFTTLSFALLSRRQVIFDIISLFPTLISLAINSYILDDFKRMKVPKKHIEKWNQLFDVMRIVNIFTLFVVLYRLFTERYLLYDWTIKLFSTAD